MNKVDKDLVRQVALDKGFKLKLQPDGEMDLNPYVYEFAESLMKIKELHALMITCEHLQDHIKQQQKDKA